MTAMLLLLSAFPSRLCAEPDALPAPWREINGTGAYDRANSTFGLRGTVGWSRHFVWQERSDDFELVARVRSIAVTPSGKPAAAGLWAVQAPDPTQPASLPAKVLSMGIRAQEEPHGRMPDHVAEAYAVSAPGSANWPMKLPIWVKLVKKGAYLGAYRSQDGLRWEPADFGGDSYGFGSAVPDPARPVLVGLFAASGAGVSEAVIDKVEFRPYTSPYVTSWFGNVGPGWNRPHFQRWVIDMAVLSDGGVYMPTAHDERGCANVYRDGKDIGWVDWRWTGPNGVVAVCDKYYLNATGRGFLRIGRQPPWTKTTVDILPKGDAWGIRGLAVSEADGEVFVANALESRIEVWDLETLKKRRDLCPLADPGSLCLEPDGLWAIQEEGSNRPPAVLKLDRKDGKELGRIAPREPWLPVDLAVATDREGSLLYVADNGPDQQVKVFDVSKVGTSRQVRAIGVKGGVWADSSGRHAPDRFLGLTAVGLDDDGNLYVGMHGKSGRKMRPAPPSWYSALRSFDRAGSPRWEMACLGVDNATLDPDDDSVVYTSFHRLRVDWNRPAGQEAKPEAFLMNLQAYPDDVRAKGLEWVCPQVVRIQGKKLLAVSSGTVIAMYRFNEAGGVVPASVVFLDGRWSFDRMVPLAFRTELKKGVKGVVPWQWIDGSAGQPQDGRWQQEEFRQMGTQDGHARLKADGTAWVTNWRQHQMGEVRELVPALDKNGIPVYEQIPPKKVPPPITHAVLVDYDPVRDALFVVGATAENPFVSGDGMIASRELIRFDGWKKGTPTLRYRTVLPFVDVKDNPTKRRGDLSTTPNISHMAVEGDYVFLAQYAPSSVHVYGADDGKEVRNGNEILCLNPGPEVWSLSTDLDGASALNVCRRKNGEYVVFLQDDMYTKVMIFRWNPGEGRP